MTNPENGESTKRCKACGLDKPRTTFSRERRAPDGKETEDRHMGALIAPCFQTAGEATDWAKRDHPHWSDPRNDVIRCRLEDAIRWHGDFSGPIRLADALGIEEDRLRRIVTGKSQATPKERRLAQAYKG